MTRQRGISLAGKRAVDVTLSAAGLTLLAPVLGALAVLIRVSMGAPVLFRQPRAGRDGRPFTLTKFRSMRHARDGAGHPLPDVVRLTRLGGVLRAASLDELPQLWNVLTGSLSLVGPRPLLVSYLPRYTAGQARRHTVLPGITGWAQVQGRNAIKWEQKFRFDVWYADHWSLGLDLAILARTIGAVLAREGISAGADATMPEFLGTPATRS